MSGDDEKMYHSLFDSMGIGAIICELIIDENDGPVDYRFLDINPLYERMFDIKRKDALGKLASELSDTGEPPHLRDILKVISDGTPGRSVINEPEKGLHLGISISHLHDNIFFMLFKDLTTLNTLEADLKEQKERYRFLAEHIADVIWTSDPEFNVNFITPSVIRTLGYTPEERMRKKLKEIVTKESYDRIQEVLREEMEREASGNADPERVVFLELEYFHASGRRVWMEERIRALRDENGRITGFIGSSHDVTGRKMMETRLRESEERFHFFFENAPDYCYIISTEGRILDANRSALRTLGYSKDEILGKDVITTIYSPSSRVKAREMFSIWKEKGKIKNEQLTIITKDGEERTVLLNADAARDPEGNIIHSVSIQRDITDLKRMEEKLRESEERYRLIVENSHEAILILDDKYRFEYVNNTFCDLTGYSGDELIGMDFRNLLDDEDRQIVSDRYIRRQRGEDLPSIYQFRVVRKNGERRIVEAIPSVVTDSGGNKRTIGQLVDITDRKLAEEALKLSRERLDLAMSVTNEGIWDWNLETNRVYFDPRYYKMSGYEVDAFPHTLEEFRKRVHPDDIEDVRRKANEYLEGKRKNYDTEFRFRRADGRWMWIHAKGRIVSRDGDGNPSRLVGTHADVTERKEMELRIKESEERYRALFDQASEAIFIFGREEGTFLDCNRATVNIFGLDDKEEIIGHSPWDFSPEVQPDGTPSIVKAKEYIDAALRGEPQRFHWKHMKKNGSEFDSEVSLNRISVPGRTYILAIVRDITDQKRAQERIGILSSVVEQSHEGVAIADLDGNIMLTNPSWVRMHGFETEGELIGKNLSIFHTELQMKDEVIPFNEKVMKYGFNIGEVGHKRRDGTTFPTLTNKTLLRDEDGKTAAMAILATNITQLKNAEKMVEEERIRAEFYLDLMNHDITNIHQGIFSWIQIMQLKKGSKIDIDTDLSPVEDLVKRSINLVRNVQILTRLKSQEPELRRTDLGAKMNEAVRSIRSIFHNRELDISFDGPGEPINIMAEPLILELFVNILHNSVKFQGDPARVEISLSRKDDRAVVKICDHGPGIPDEIKPQIFDRFRRKDRKFHSGIGLSLVKELVERYKGTIEVSDRVKDDSSRGACFTVRFPLADE